MHDKPSTARGYTPDHVARVKATCLYLATKLGDLASDMVVVGGLVPSLLIDQENRAGDVAPHVGTLDLDLGLRFALLGEQRYQEVAARLRQAGFIPDESSDGKLTRQRWRISEPMVTVDFLVEPSPGSPARPGSLLSLAPDWAAITTPGLHLAFRNQRSVRLAGRTITGEAAERHMPVCGAGAFVVLKALAFHVRGENKDAYDLFYMLRNYGDGVADVADQLRPLLVDPVAAGALECLRLDFQSPGSIGPRRAAEFLYGRPDPDTEADVVGFVRLLLAACDA